MDLSAEQRTGDKDRICLQGTITKVVVDNSGTVTMQAFDFTIVTIISGEFSGLTWSNLRQKLRRFSGHKTKRLWSAMLGL